MEISDVQKNIVKIIGGAKRYFLPTTFHIGGSSFIIIGNDDIYFTYIVCLGYIVFFFQMYNEILQMLL